MKRHFSNIKALYNTQKVQMTVEEFSDLIFTQRPTEIWLNDWSTKKAFILIEKYVKISDNRGGEIDAFVGCCVPHGVGVGDEITFTAESFMKRFKHQGFENMHIDVNEDLLRHTGRSTRLADKYIQDLFEKGVVKINDHYVKEKSHHLWNVVMRRLQNEHDLNEFKFDQLTYTIELIK